MRGSNILGKQPIINARRKRKKEFMAAAYMAKKKGALLMVGISSQNSAIAKVSRFTRRKKKQPNIKLRWLYSIHNQKKISPSDRRQFVKKAYIYTMKDFGKEFMNQANKRLNK